MKKVDIMCSSQPSIERQQHTTPARKQVTPHLHTVFVSPSCFESSTFLPHVIPAFSGLPLTFQPASHLHTVSRKNMSISRHWSTDASWALWLTHCFKSLGSEWKAHLDYKTRRADANEKEGGNMGNAVSFTPSNWSARIQRDYKQLKQAVTLQTIKYLIKPQHERAFGRGKAFWCVHIPSRSKYI